MRKCLLAVMFLVLLVASVSFAGQATINWTPPTAYVDTTTILPADQARIIYTAYWGTTAGTYPNKLVLGTGVSTGVVPNLTVGTTYYFVVTATLNSLESAQSNAVNRQIPFVAVGAVTVTSVTSP